MLQRIRSSAKTAATVAFEATALVGSASGAAAAIVFGKAFLAIALSAFAFGVFVRLSGRRRGALAPEMQAPRWVAPAVALATTVEAAVLVEAVDLPVRLSQPGFQYYHWLFVLAFLVAAYTAQTKVLRQLLVKPKQAQNELTSTMGQNEW